ncbi:MAG: DUF1294 domain-containing protein [Pirellulales bacterium]
MNAASVSSQRVILSAISLSLFPLLWLLAQRNVIPFWLFWAFAIMSSITFVLYGRDKWAAKVNDRRTPERVLQLCALFCGWPGALFGQQVFRHKTSKMSFQVTFWLVVALNCATMLVVFLSRDSVFVK